jgi:hypothetical protein
MLGDSWDLARRTKLALDLKVPGLYNRADVGAWQTGFCRARFDFTPVR